jgi:hypothetical protein
MRATMRVEGDTKDRITLFLFSAHPDIQKNPVSVKLIGDNGYMKEEVFTDNRWKQVELKGDELKGLGALTCQVSRTWSPESAGISQDNRDLGVAVAIH